MRLQRPRVSGRLKPLSFVLGVPHAWKTFVSLVTCFCCWVRSFEGTTVYRRGVFGRQGQLCPLWRINLLEFHVSQSTRGTNSFGIGYRSALQSLHLISWSRLVLSKNQRRIIRLGTELGLLAIMLFSHCADFVLATAVLRFLCMVLSDRTEASGGEIFSSAASWPSMAPWVLDLELFVAEIRDSRTLFASGTRLLAALVFGVVIVYSAIGTTQVDQSFLGFAEEDDIQTSAFVRWRIQKLREKHGWMTALSVLTLALFRGDFVAYATRARGDLPLINFGKPVAKRVAATLRSRIIFGLTDYHHVAKGAFESFASLFRTNRVPLVLVRSMVGWGCVYIVVTLWTLIYSFPGRGQGRRTRNYYLSSICILGLSGVFSAATLCMAFLGAMQHRRSPVEAERFACFVAIIACPPPFLELAQSAASIALDLGYRLLSRSMGNVSETQPELSAIEP